MTTPHPPTRLCRVITRASSRTARADGTHVRAPRDPHMTLCRRTVVGHGAPPDDDTAPATCLECRRLERLWLAERAADREWCWKWTRQWQHGAAPVRCSQRHGHTTPHDGAHPTDDDTDEP